MNVRSAALFALTTLSLALLGPPPAQAATYYAKIHAVTDTPAVVTFDQAARTVEVLNIGPDPAFVAIGAAASASSGTVSLQVQACAGYKLIFTAANAPSTLGIVTATGKTASLDVKAFYETESLQVTNSDKVQFLTSLPSCAGLTPTYTTVNAGTFALTGSGSTISTANGASLAWTVNSEAITLSTGGATTDSAANLLPANSIIDSVVCRVTTTITTATDWGISDPTTTLRFSAVDSTMTAGETIVGLKHMFGVVSSTAAGPTQASAAKLRITTTGTPGAGAVRCTVFARVFVAPTS